MKRLFTVFAICWLCGCKEIEQISKATENLEKLNSQVILLIEAKIKLENELQEVQYKLVRLAGDAAEFKARQSEHSFAFMDPTETSYSVIKYSYGAAFIKVENLRAYGSGSKATFSVGNPLYAWLYKSEFTVNWGADLENEKKVEFLDAIPPGSWKKIEVSLDGVQPKDLKTLWIRDFSSGAISLAGSR